MSFNGAVLKDDPRESSNTRVTPHVTRTGWRKPELTLSEKKKLKEKANQAEISDKEAEELGFSKSEKESGVERPKFGYKPKDSFDTSKLSIRGDPSAIPIKDGVASSMVEDDEYTAELVDEKGKPVEDMVVFFDKETYDQRRWEEPFMVSMGIRWNRDTFHKSVLDALDKISAEKDPGLRAKFINWYCEQFRRNNKDDFDNEKKLSKGVDVIGHNINRLLNTTETPVPNKGWQTMAVTDSTDEGGLSLTRSGGWRAKV